MCYLGMGDTYTPCHKDLCASSGNNIMCYTENDGSSFWFMTETSAARQVSDYFHQLNQELDHENYFITIEDLAQAPFNIYLVQQRLGDMVLVPPRSSHQVVNYGGITLKIAWSRMTIKGLSLAFHYELPIYRRYFHFSRVDDLVFQAHRAAEYVDLRHTKSNPLYTILFECSLSA